MHKNKEEIKLDKSKENNIKFRTFSRNFYIGNNHTYNTAKTAKYSHPYSKKNIMINTFRYDKLYFYEKEKHFLTQIKKHKSKERKINLKKINKFHQLIIQDKVKSLSESKDNNDLTMNNRTTNYSEFISTNHSINIKNSKNFNYRNLLIKSSNLPKYNKEIEFMKINIDKRLKKNDINSKLEYFEKLSNKDINNLNKRNSLSISLNENKFIKNKVNNSFNIKNQQNFLNYKFTDINGNANDNIYKEGQLCTYRDQNNFFSELIKAKLKYNIINKVQYDFFESQKETLDNPINLYEYYENFNKRNKNYFQIFTHLFKKYFGYLYTKIENEKQELILLKEKKENLKESIFQLTKKINSTKEKKTFFQNLLKLLIKIRYNIDSIDKIPREYLKKYGIIENFPNFKNKNKDYRKRNSMLITELKDYSYIKYLRKDTKENVKQNKEKNRYTIRNSVIFMNPNDIEIKATRASMIRSQSPNKREKYKISQKIPIFNSEQELDSKIRGIELNLKNLYKESVNKEYFLQQLKLELSKNKSEFHEHGISYYSLYDIEKEELDSLKEKNELYKNFKSLLLSDNNNYIEYKPKIIKKISLKETNKRKELNFSDKLISILLKFDINIEKLINQEGIYKFLNSTKDIKIIFNGKEYQKVLFCVKILEMVYLRLLEQRAYFLTKEKIKDKYLRYEEEIDRIKRNKKLSEKAEEEINKRKQKEKELYEKLNKFIWLPYKKDDRFSYNLKRNKAIKISNLKRMKIENKDKVQLMLENAILY